MKIPIFNFDTTYTALPNHLFTTLKPTPVSSPEIVIVNKNFARSIGINIAHINSDEQAAIFSGNYLVKESTPFAQAYAGHQFGYFSILGDGRAVMLGEHITPDKQRLDIQLKGAGSTPYSRSGDGRAALGPMLREYIVSEAIHHLGIPTTRGLAVVKTGENVRRETTLPGAILTRIASSHIRVGTFQLAASQGDVACIQSLLDYTIKRHFPELTNRHNTACALLYTVVEKQAELITHWMRVGFIHGVMNTDNMTLSGETIDYGPCAFMDAYQPNTTLSSIDDLGRYAYANQPKIAQWNLTKLAETLLPLIDKDRNKAINIAEAIIRPFKEIYHKKWMMMMRAKLGLFGSYTDDESLITHLLSWMESNHADYTNTFRDLTQKGRPKGRIYQQKAFNEWYIRWQNRLQQHSTPFDASLRLMRSNNPTVIPRNHTIEQILEAANAGDFASLREALDIFKTPYEVHDNRSTYQAPPKPSERIYQTFCGT